MRIASIMLRDYVNFKDSDIKELHVTFNEKVQIVIGGNGSGKSSLLRQLSTTPPVRSVFDKQGFKSLVVENHGVYYKLESDYSKPSSPHLFFEGDNPDNLNQGRTTETQKELIEEHLGITKILDDLIMNRYVFPKWTAAKRKEFLMEANPDQIGFVLVHIKQIASQIKACRNNLSRLSERKILLEQQLLDNEAMLTLVKEKEQIEKELTGFQQNLMDLEVGLRTLGTIPDASITHLPSVRQTVNRCRQQLRSLGHIERHDRSRQIIREDTQSAIAVSKQQIVEKEERIEQLTADLNDMETRYRDVVSDGDLLQIDSTIERLEAEQVRLQVDAPILELTPEELAQRYQELNDLTDKLQLFHHLPVPLLPSKKRQHRERMLQNSQYKQSSWGMRLNDYEQRYDQLTRQHTVKPNDIPDSPCAKDGCPLYRHFMGEYTDAEDKRQSLQRSIEKGRRKIRRLDSYVTGLITYLEQSKPYTDRIHWLVNHAQSNPLLHFILRQMDILTVLSTNPNRITHLLGQMYAHMEQWHKLKQVRADLEMAHTLKSRQISLESGDTINLVSSIETTKKALYELRSDVIRLSHKQASLERLLEDINSFNQIKETLLTIQQHHDTTRTNLINQHEKDRLTLLREGVENLRRQHFVRMSDIEKTLKSQSGLQERYDEEVVGQIALIEKELSDLQHIETSLIRIPKENMISFINNVFGQANRLIELVWALPLQIELLKADDSLNYEFQVSGDNQSVRELSECSEGQTEMISLAINLALRMVLGHFDYPICLDETGRTMDEKHRHNLVQLLRKLLDDKIISQLFYVSHNAMVYESFAQSETLVIRSDNILLPEVYNLHATIQ